MNSYYGIQNQAGNYWQCGAGFVSRDPEHATKYDSEAEAWTVVGLSSFIRGTVNVVPNNTPFRMKLPPARRAEAA